MDQKIAKKYQELIEILEQYSHFRDQLIIFVELIVKGLKTGDFSSKQACNYFRNLVASHWYPQLDQLSKALITKGMLLELADESDKKTEKQLKDLEETLALVKEDIKSEKRWQKKITRQVKVSSVKISDMLRILKKH